MAKKNNTNISQSILGGIGNNNVVSISADSDGAGTKQAMELLATILDSYEPTESQDPTQTEFISTMQLQKTVQDTIGVELALQIIYQALLDAGLKQQFITTVPALQKGIYFLAHKKP